MTISELNLIEEIFLKNGIVSKENIQKLLSFTKSQILKNNVINEMPKQFIEDLGYEPEKGIKYDCFVAYNKNKYPVFLDSEDISSFKPSEYILFLIINDKFIAVDGSNEPNAWDLNKV